MIMPAGLGLASTSMAIGQSGTVGFMKARPEDLDDAAWIAPEGKAEEQMQKMTKWKHNNQRIRQTD